MTCNFCQKMPLPTSNRHGSCASCGKQTSSTAIQLCSSCAKSQNKCSRCQRPMTNNPLLSNAVEVCDSDSCCVF